MSMEDKSGVKDRRKSSPGGTTPVDSTIFIKRQPYTQAAFDEIYLKEKNTDKPPIYQRALEKVSCTPKKVFKIDLECTTIPWNGNSQESWNLACCDMDSGP